MSAPVRYRVWCLSWEEEEEHGADVVSYDILKHDYNKRVPRGIVYVPDTVLYDARGAAEAYGDHVYSQRDGYESSWPLVFRVRCPDGSTTDFDVDMALVPQFSASPVKQPAAEVKPPAAEVGEEPIDVRTDLSHVQAMDKYLLSLPRALHDADEKIEEES